MLKKKLPTVKTLTKHKPINSHYHEKNTVKKPLVKSLGRSITKNMRKNEIMMQDCNNKQHIFELNGDRDIFESRIVLPSIPMDCDNDT